MPELSIPRLGFSLVSLMAAATACTAGRSAEREELAELRSEVRASRERARELDRRLARLEALNAIQNRSELSPSSEKGAARGSEPVSESGRSVPSLAVVKLKPRPENAPRLDTQTPVVEPGLDSDQVERLMKQLASGGAKGSQVPQVPEEDDAILHKEFEQNVARLRTGNVEGGVSKLQEFAAGHPAHPDADNALYFSGLGLMGLGKHEQAAEVFSALVDRFPAGDAVIDATLRLAECRERLKDTADAKALYTRVVTRYPGTAAASQAEQRLNAWPR